MEGYYLYSIFDENETEIGIYCADHTIQITFCQTMSNNSKDVCYECESEYYLESNNCVERVNIIDKCIEYSISMDSCEVCEEDYLTNSEKTLCFPIIENCYNIVKGATELLCS